jgi:hypothetical protein
MTRSVTRAARGRSRGWPGPPRASAPCLVQTRPKPPGSWPARCRTSLIYPSCPRGPGADLIGRTAALLIDMPVETTPGGWRIAERPGRYIRAAHSMMSADLDALEEVFAGYEGPLKINLCGPWTLAATIELARALNPVLADPGAVADLTGSLAEGAAAHVAEVAKRVPGAQLLVQLDEPALAAAAYGEVPTASGLSRLPAADAAVMSDRLETVMAATGRYSVIHCYSGFPRNWLPGAANRREVRGVASPEMLAAS